jgi:hypothetical protein
MGRVYSQEIHAVFEHLRQYGYIKLAPASDTSYLFVEVNSIFAASTLSSGAKSVMQSFKKPGVKAADPLDRFNEEVVRERNSSIVSMELDEKTSNDVVFRDTLAMIIPVITREQNIIMDMFGMRPSDLIGDSVADWQVDLGSRTREAIKEQKSKRLIK